MKLILTSLCLLALTAGVVLAADVNGSWKASVPGRDGATFDMTFTFKADGEKLTGTVGSAMGETSITDGKVTGDKITFKVKLEFQGNSMVINYEGAVSASEIKFKSTREGSDRPPREFVAKKI
ncbi:MAG: hypothetical protein ACE15B_08950 [Bryobacteraceae bacterium]